nr:GNAT family N-acetyltransferase [Streptomyces sp. NRRL WC-3549]
MTSESDIDGRPRAGTSGCVRPRAGGDLDACVDLLAQVHERDGYPVNWPENAADWLVRPWFLAAWVAELDGRIAGHVALSRTTPGDAAPGLLGARDGVVVEAMAVISRLFVAPWARGHGLGELLMRRAEEEARERGLRLVLDVVTSDTAATALYQRLGWRLLGTAEQQWGPDVRVMVRCYEGPEAG